MSLLLALTSAAGDIVVALTGQSFTASQGVFAVSLEKALVGNAVSQTQDSLTAFLSQVLTGVSTGQTQGALTVAASKALAGNLATESQDSLTANFNKALTGSIATENFGALAASLSASLLNQSQTFQQGAVQASNITLLVGTSATVQQNNLVPVYAVSLSGGAESEIIGTLTPSTGTDIQLTGLQQSFSAGVLSLSISASISTNNSTLVPGSLLSTTSKSIAGLQLTGFTGALTPVVTTLVQLTGIQQAFSASSFAVAVTKDLAGNTLVENQGALTPSAVKNIAGTTAILQAGLLLPSLDKILFGNLSTIEAEELLVNYSLALESALVHVEQGSVTADIFTGVLSALRTLRLNPENRTLMQLNEIRLALIEAENRLVSAPKG